MSNDFAGIKPIFGDDGTSTFVSPPPIPTAEEILRAHGVVIAPEPSVPPMVTNFQARAALIAAGVFDDVDAFVRASGDVVALQAWDYANHFYRDGELIRTMATQFGMSDAQLDDLFRSAARIEA